MSVGTEKNVSGDGEDWQPFKVVNLLRPHWHSSNNSKNYKYWDFMLSNAEAHIITETKKNMDKRNKV